MVNKSVSHLNRSLLVLFSHDHLQIRHLRYSGGDLEWESAKSSCCSDCHVLFLHMSCPRYHC